MEENYTSVSRKIANILSAQIIIKPNCVLGLATGSTPLGTYKQLIEWYQKGDLDFSMVKTVNLDEYMGIPSTDTHSYAYYMKTNFYEHININQKNTHIPNGMATDIKAECRRYDEMIENLGGIDIQLLGIGHNGHVGFNEPGEIFMKDTYLVNLSEDTINANSRFFENIKQTPEKALTVGLKTIMQAKRIVIAVCGSLKAEILYRMLTGPITPHLPASILQLHSNVTLIADKDALEVTLKKCPEMVTGER